jgi:pimeloyl-ACP methyl ester carboxylesterase
VKRITLALSGLLLAGAVYQIVGDRRDRIRFPQIGRSVDVGGRSLNIFCSGEGTLTVVFDSGRGMPGYSWLLIQPQIAKTMRACWYDRAGLGWSDPGPGSRSSDAVARDLHQLLQRAGVAPPYVLVGHSMGGFNIRVYQKFYPADVAGLVLVDARQEGMEARIPDMPRSLEALCPSCPRRPLSIAVEALGRVGLLRLWSFESDPAPPGVSAEEWERLASLSRRPSAWASAIREHSGRENDRELGAADLGDLPLIVLTAGHAFAGSPRVRTDALPTVQRDWVELQRELARRSTRGQQRVVAESDHMIPYEAPQAVIDAVQDVVMEIRDASRANPTRPTR